MQILPISAGLPSGVRMRALFASGKLQMTRTLRITMEVVIDHFPADEIDEIEVYAEEEDETVETATASILADANPDEVAECIQQACFDEELFAGSMLYLKVLVADVVFADWKDAIPDDVSATKVTGE